MPARTSSKTTAALRASGGCQDTDANNADFAAGAPAPRNSATPAHACDGPTPPSISSRTPASGAADVPVNSDVAITFNQPVDTSGTFFTIACATSGAHTATASGGPTTFTLDPDANFAQGESCTVTVLAAQITAQGDPGNPMAGNDSWSFSTVAAAARIHDIQGRSHISPLNGKQVSGVTGIVTARRTSGYYLQDPDPDSDEATSEGIFVFTSSAPAVNVGDSVSVSGRVNEFRPGGTGLTNTEIGSPRTTILSSGNPLPAPIVIGTGGRVPPNTVIDSADSPTGNIETGGTFDPVHDGIDFHESLEDMRVQLNDAVAVGPTNQFDETQVIGDDASDALVRTNRGGVLLQPGKANPQRLVAAPDIVSNPVVNVGDHYTAPLVGVLDYDFGNYRIELTTAPAAVHDGVTPETTTDAGAHQLTIATFNVENLSPADPASKFTRLASLIAGNMRSPDIITVEEVQDNDGPADDGVVSASVTLSTLISAIQAAGGPAYQFREIDPVNDQDGGQPGGNIRQVFLFRTDYGLSFVDRPGGGSTTATTVVQTPDGPELSASPGRVDPGNSAWSASRKPLAGEFAYQGHHLFVIGNHLIAKLGDDPLEGPHQPPIEGSEPQRVAQTTVLHDFVSQILADDANANVVVAGDFNDFEFSQSVSELKTAGLNDLFETLPLPERYSYVFEGNSQALDHVMVSGGIAARPTSLDVVHVNAEFADQASDHDPAVATITFNDPPSISAGGPYTVGEGGSITLNAVATDPEGGPVTVAWDLDGDGTFETSGPSATFSAAGIDGPAARTVAVRATDDSGQAAVASATITIADVAPAVVTPTLVPEPSRRFLPAIAFATFTDPGPDDRPFSCTVDYGDGGGAHAGLVVANVCVGAPHVYLETGTFTVTVRVTDKDGLTGSSSTAHSVLRLLGGGARTLDGPLEE